MSTYERWISVTIMMLQAGTMAALFFINAQPFADGVHRDATAFESYARTVESGGKDFTLQQQVGILKNCAATIRIRDQVIEKNADALSPIIKVLGMMLVLQLSVFVVGLRRKPKEN